MKVQLRNIVKMFGSFKAVDNFNLTILSGECLCLLGPSGCGKTTILRIIAGLEKATDGHVYFDGEVMDSLPPRNRDVAFVFQNYSLYPHMSVFDNLSFPLVARKEPKEEIQQKVKSVSEMLRIDSLLFRMPKQLSGGEAQRVALGRAVIRTPKLFLMDEPLSNIDAKLRVDMRVELEELHRKLGITTIYVTHDQEEAMTLGERLAIMNKGILQQVGTPEEVYNKPVNTFVAGFIGSPAMNFINGIFISEGGRIIVKAGTLSFPLEWEEWNGTGCAEGRKIILGIRPEHISFEPAENKAEVVLTESLGREMRVYIKSGQDTLIGVVDAFADYKTGDIITFSFDKKKIHLFDQDTGTRLS